MNGTQGDCTTTLRDYALRVLRVLVVEYATTPSTLHLRFSPFPEAPISENGFYNLDLSYGDIYLYGIII